MIIREKDEIFCQTGPEKNHQDADDLEEVHANRLVCIH